MTLSEYIEKLHDRMAERPDARFGQQAFVVLWQNRPDLANTIQGTDLDPFYDNKRIDALLAWLADRLESS